MPPPLSSQPSPPSPAAVDLARREPSRFGRLVAGLGSAQLIAWGTLYYAIAVIGEPMGRELALSQTQVFGSFAWSLALSGLLAPWTGRLLDRYGGRVVLFSGMILGALGFLCLARSTSFTMLLVGWSLNGLAMALGLYDTCFAAIGQADPRSYRRTVTGVTLVAGFASTCFWPLTHYLVRELGWRSTCEALSLCLLLSAPIYLRVLPAIAGRHSPGQVVAAAHAPRPAAAAIRRARALALAFAGVTWIGAAMSAHLVGTLTTLRFTAEQAVWIASSVGMLQVLGRTLELRSSRPGAVQLGFFTFIGLTAAMLVLLASQLAPWLVVVFALVYGTANGLFTIAKAVVPVEILGTRNLGAVLGSFGAPSLVMRAVAPVGFAAIASQLGTQAALWSTAAIGLASLWAYMSASAGAKLEAAPEISSSSASAPLAEPRDVR